MGCYPESGAESCACSSPWASISLPKTHIYSMNSFNVHSTLQCASGQCHCSPKLHNMRAAQSVRESHASHQAPSLTESVPIAHRDIFILHCLSTARVLCGGRPVTIMCFQRHHPKLFFAKAMWTMQHAKATQWLISLEHLPKFLPR